MAIKKYSSGQWVDIPYRKYESASDTITTLPKTIIADGQSASAIIKGNLSQSGTPTPASPIYPTETGDKTANLFDMNATDTTKGYVSDKYLNYLGEEVSNAQAAISEYIPVAQLMQYTLVYGSSLSAPSVCFYDSDYQYISGVRYNALITVTVSAPNGAKYLRLSFYKSQSNTVMLNEGSTALPYEPFGIKIPILSGGQTTNVYLGEVQSTRNIKKMVLTSSTNVNWQKSSLRNYSWYFGPETIGLKGNTPFLCSHGATVTSVNEFVYGTVYCDNTVNLGIFPSTLTTANDVKAWLDEQNANGTPVIIWNVLTTPTTTTLNEPIRKIGNYSDSVSVTGLPTTGTAEQFDIDTTLKPSEVDLTYHGWHEHSDEKYVD